MKETNGVVMNVVMSVMRTSMTKMLGGRMCMSYPIVKITNSINPRVFIKAPMFRLSFQLSPVNRVASVVPPNIPTIAISVNIPHIPHSSGVLSSPISVLKPVDTKNRGKNNANETSSTFSVRIFRNLMFEGMTTPAKKAPNRA